MKKTATILAALLLGLAAPATAQVTKGETSLNLNATLSVGYVDDYTNTAGSDHSIAGAGQADLSGFYFNPNFLSFDIEPYYNQSRLNSTYQSTTSASGVSASAKIFSGSPFPGSISYSNAYNSSGNFGIPGLANYTTHGDSDTLALTWGVHIKNKPSLSLSFSDTDSSYSIYGAGTLGGLHSKLFSASSAYQIAGFHLDGGYEYNGAKTVTPAFLAGEESQASNSVDNSFFVGVGHDLPWNGSFSAGAVHLKINTAYNDQSSAENYNTTIDSLNSTFNFAPVTHLDFGGSAYYTDNLEGTLLNSVLTAGATLPPGETPQSSHDLNLTATGNYILPRQHLDFRALFQRQQQSFMGISYSSDSYNGTATYSNLLLGGQFNGVLGLTRTSLSSSEQSLLGLNASTNYSHALQRWTLAGGFSYSQNTQTVLIAYTTSGYSYNGSVGRRFRRRTYWGITGSGARSLLTGVPGSANDSQSYTTSFSVSRFSLSGSYSKSSGNALLTSTGLVSTPVPVTALPSSAVVIYNGSSYSAGFGSSPIRGLTLSAAYSKALSGTTSNSTLSSNKNQNIYFLMIYTFRKLSFNAGYSRLVQGFSSTGNTPATDTSYYVGVSRWFNFF